MNVGSDRWKNQSRLHEAHVCLIWSMLYFANTISVNHIYIYLNVDLLKSTVCMLVAYWGHLNTLRSQKIISSTKLSCYGSLIVQTERGHIPSVEGPKCPYFHHFHGLVSCIRRKQNINNESIDHKKQKCFFLKVPWTIVTIYIWKTCFFLKTFSLWPQAKY